MILENFWIYLIAFWVSGYVFSYPMEKLENFKRKQLIYGLAAILLGTVILHLPEKNLLLTEAIFMLIGCMLMTLMMHTCWDVSWSVAIYNVIWAISIWQVVIEGSSMLILLRRMYRPDANGEQLIIIGTYLLAYFMCGATIAKWMPVGRKSRLGPRQMSLSVLLFGIINMLSFHERIGVTTVLPYEWGYYYLTQMICIVVLYLESELFKKSQLKQEKELLDFLYKTQQEQYKISRETIALINQKSHDLKHQIRALRNADKEELDRYLGEIENSVEIYEAIVKTGNDVFDTILTEKSLYCQKHGIVVSCVADGGTGPAVVLNQIHSGFGNNLMPPGFGYLPDVGILLPLFFVVIDGVFFGNIAPEGGIAVTEDHCITCHKQSPRVWFSVL